MGRVVKLTFVEVETYPYFIPNKKPMPPFPPSSAHRVSIRTRCRMRCDSGHFLLDHDLRVDLDGAAFFRRKDEKKVPRNGI